MKLYFIRHAIAMERAEWSDDDLLRPLTDKGRKRARQAFEGLSRIADEPDIIFTSRATRAVQTAEILNKAFPGARLEQTELLNPGAGLEDLRLLLHQNDMESRIAALVGHEPDFSEMISGLLQGRSETNGNDFRYWSVDRLHQIYSDRPVQYLSAEYSGLSRFISIYAL